MGKCPFALGAAADPPASSDVCSSEADDEPAGAQQQPKWSGCPLMRPAAAEDDARFDYHKDPVAWFYQNQIRSEEEFQAKKAALRTEARRRLDTIFAAKGKHLIIDSDDDDFSIGSSELSAWDSEVHSIHSLASAANSWAQEAHFTAPALTTLRAVLLLVLAAAAHCGWQALQAMLHVNRFWGILQHGWVPAAALGLAVAAAAAAGGFWYATDAKHKHGLLAAQLAMHLLCAALTVVALLCWVFPSRVDSELRTSVCAGGAERESAASSRLCQYLPLVQEQVNLAMASILRGSGLLAASALAAACAGTWHFWELAYVEKKAAKHKRRRRHRRHAIPWEKIKIDEMGPVSYCGGGPPRAAATTAVAAAPAGAAEPKKDV